MKILVATDAWYPQVNGVLATYLRLEKELPVLGCELSFLTPDQFRTVAMPGYREIALALPNRHRASKSIEATAPDHIHIATEGPVGWMARAYCLRRGLPFTTSFHTRFPEYAAALFGRALGMSTALVYAGLRHFHHNSAGIMVATPSLHRELSEKGFRNIHPWTRGVDTELFQPRAVRLFGSERPVFLYVGRVSREKNIEAFLRADLPGLKVVVGSGPHLAALAHRFPRVRFVGRKTGEELAQHFASADVFVFPSRTDTFGLVVLEAMASGLPVAAYPVTGPVDIIENGISGCIDDDLEKAALQALALDPASARRRALHFTWAETARLFVENIRISRAMKASESATRPLRQPSRSAATISPWRT